MFSKYTFCVNTALQANASNIRNVIIIRRYIKRWILPLNNLRIRCMINVNELIVTFLSYSFNVIFIFDTITITNI